MWNEGWQRTKNMIIRFVKWSILGIITGVIVGVFATGFAKALSYATLFRESHPYTFFTLPIGGVLIVLLYKLTGMENDGGTDNVINSLHDDIVVPLRLAFCIFIATLITIFCGGSVGREGAALQMGASLGNTVCRSARFDKEDRKVLIMTGMAAAFGALFGTPMAAAFFSMEVASIGIMHYAAIVPCIFASLSAYEIIRCFGVRGENFIITESYDMSVIFSLKVFLIAALCALISIIFCIALQSIEKVGHTYLKNKFLRIIVGSAILIVLNLFIGTNDYQGTGMAVIERALHGEADTWAFFWKLVFTVITIAAGFKGGEIVPSFFIGATFGCMMAGLLGLPTILGASVGMIAVFCGVTNCPVASILIAIEMFGTNNIYYILIGVAVSYMLSGYFSLYHTQVIFFSKGKEEAIRRKIGHLFK